MKTKENAIRKLFPLFGYTIVFIIVSFGVFLPFILEHKSFIWKADGLFQTFSSMVYVSEYYKSMISGLLQGNFNPKMIDFHIGLGYDVFTTLNYYGLGDPLLLFSVFFDKENMYIFYNLLVISRLYLSGIAFLMYCNKMKKESFSSVVGAVIYVFCGFAIVAGERHPYFLNAMIYLPLLLIGIENILKKKKSYLFSGMVFVSVISNYYFFYMLTIMAFLYAIIRFFDVYRMQWKKSIGNILLRGVIQYVIGVLLAAFALVPTIYAFLNNARGTTGTYENGFLYFSRYYLRFIYGFFNAPTDIDGNFTFLAYAPICVFAVVFLFLYKENRKKFIALKCSYVLATLMLFTPVAAYVMNGMSYPSNRWVFGYSFLTAFLVVCVLDDLLKVTIKRFIPMMVISALLLAIYLLMGGERDRFPINGILLLIITIAVLACSTRVRNKQMKYSSVLVVTMAAVISFGYYQNSPQGKNYVDQFRENKEAINIIENCPETSIELEADQTFHRIGSYGNQVENQALILGYNGTSSYYSLVDGNILTYMKDMELTSMEQPHRFYGLDERTYLGALAAVKYYAFEAESVQEKEIPYGFKEVNRTIRKNSDVTDVIYENQYTLPIGYTYDKEISTEYYNTLSSVQKQQAMLQAAVVEVVDNNSWDTMKYSEEQLDYILDESNGITWDKDTGSFHVESENATLTLHMTAKENCETYVRLVGLDVESSNTSHFSASVVSQNAEAKLYLTNSKYRWDLEKENYLVNLGHKNKGETSCTITFKKAGEFVLKDIEVISLPMKDYEEQVVKLAEEALTNVQMSNNKITGNITVSQDKILCFSILYNAGWKVKIDGVEAPLYKANTMYMATDISKGSHTIELTYQTPGMKVGLLISLVALIALISVAIFSYFTKKSALIQKN